MALDMRGPFGLTVRTHGGGGSGIDLRSRRITVAVIAVKSLTRFYGTRRGVVDLSLSVPEGSLFGFLGPNGAGKTTTIRVLLGFLRASSGSAEMLGRDCWRHSHVIKRDVGYVPGDLRLYPWMDGHSGLRMVGAVRGLDLAAAGKKLAERYGLDMRVKVRAMSRGMRQKLGLILAMAHEPRVLVLDEPTTGLDPLTQETFRAHLRELAAAGRTAFFSSHTLSEVEAVCDRVAIVREGRIVLDDTLAGLRQRAGHEVTILWRDGAAPAQPPVFLRLHARRDDLWQGALSGGVQSLIAWLADKPVADLSIGRPDLESLFRQFYGETAISSSEPAGEAHP